MPAISLCSSHPNPHQQLSLSYQSTTATRSKPYLAFAWSAAIPALPNKQKPMGSLGSAWWPGGRTAQNAEDARPSHTASTALQAAPHARRAASALPFITLVSPSRLTVRFLPSALAQAANTLATCCEVWNSFNWSSVAPGASRTTRKPLLGGNARSSAPTIDLLYYRRDEKRKEIKSFKHI